jgi:predicted acyl esterase
MSLNYEPTVGTSGGLWSGGLPFGLPGDQAADEIRSLVFTSAPLSAPLTIAGYPRVSLRVSSTAQVAAFVVKLAEVAHDGRSALVARGIANVTRRSSSCRGDSQASRTRNRTDTPKPMLPGRIYRIDIPIDATAWRFEAGHRIRIAISGSDFPNSWPTPLPSRLKLHFGTGSQSAGSTGCALHLPILPASRLAPPHFDPPPVPAKPAPATSLPDPDIWEYRDDVLSQTVTLHVRRGGPTRCPTVSPRIRATSSS